MNLQAPTWQLARCIRRLRARLDAFYFHLYILSTFPIIQLRDEAAFGHYRTKDLILACMNAPGGRRHRNPTGGLEPMRVVEDPLNRETIQAITVRGRRAHARRRRPR